MIRPALVACTLSALIVTAATAQSPEAFRPVPATPGIADAASVEEAEAEAARLGRAAVIAGVETYSELVSDYVGTPLFDPGQAVGRLLREDAGGSMSEGSTFERCTAWLVGYDVILTAHHCLPEGVGDTAANVSVQFGYRMEAGLSRPTSAPFRIGEILEADDELDYLLARVVVAPGQSKPGNSFGIIRVARDGSVRHGEPLSIVHHPYGFSQLLIKDGTCRAIEYTGEQTSYLFHRCDTWSGSSGAPVLSYLPGWLPASQYRTETVAVGLHIAGQQLVNDYALNIATRLPEIVAVSDYLRPIACAYAADGWRCPSLNRPSAPTIFVAFQPGGGWLPLAPGGGTLSQETRVQLNQIAGEIRSASEFVRVRIYGDATIEEVYSASGSAEILANGRDVIASTRANAVWQALQSTNALPGPGSGVFWILEMGYSRSEPGGPPSRPNRSGVEVFIEFAPASQ